MILEFFPDTLPYRRLVLLHDHLLELGNEVEDLLQRLLFKRQHLVRVDEIVRLLTPPDLLILVLYPEERQEPENLLQVVTVVLDDRVAVLELLDPFRGRRLADILLESKEPY